MSSKLGIYWSVMHRPPQHYDFLRRLQPAVLKIMDGGAPDYAWAYANLPDALIIARDHPLSEQHDDMLRDPVGTGVRHAREWDQHANRLGLDRKRTLVLGINEPRVWEPGVAEALRQYTIAMCDEGTRLGLRIGAKQLSVGWPGNNGADTPPDWSQWHGVEDAIKRGNHVLVLHEYWADQGPFENWGWWGGRGIKCPWQVPIVIGECGIDMYVKDGSVDKRSRGWIGRVSPGRYADELWEFNRRWAEDERFEGSCVYALDCADCETWGCFNIESACDAILALPTVRSTPTPAPVTVHLPIVEGQPVSQDQGEINWRRAYPFVLNMEGGFSTDPNDKGNYTPSGEFKGTKYGISARSYPHLDIANLTKEQALEIYKRDYWLPSGAASQPWPLCLATFDVAINHGVGAAKRIHARQLSEIELYMAKRMLDYITYSTWRHHGVAWGNRVRHLLEEVEKA